MLNSAHTQEIVMKTGDKVKIRIKSGVCPSYLTEGKVYEAVVYGLEFNGVGLFFKYKSDDGYELGSNQHDSAHLKGGDWEIVEMIDLHKEIDELYLSDNDISEAVGENVSADVIKSIRAAKKLTDSGKAGTSALEAVYANIGRNICEDVGAYLESVAEMKGA